MCRNRAVPCPTQSPWQQPHRCAPRYALGDFDAVAVKSRDLAGVVGHEPHLADSEIDEHLRPFAVISQIGSEAERHVGLYRIKPLFLLLVGVKLVGEPDAAPFVD